MKALTLTIEDHDYVFGTQLELVYNILPKYYPHSPFRELNTPMGLSLREACTMFNRLRIYP